MKRALLCLGITIVMAILFLFFGNWLDELKHLIDVNHVH
jgi:hypothetical protein